MSILFVLILCLSLAAALAGGCVSQTSAALFAGAARGITLALDLAGPLCLWTGFTSVLQASGAKGLLQAMTAPLLSRLFPQGWMRPEVRAALGANLTANLLGLGNAATPPGIEAARLLSSDGGYCTDELCTLVVLNTASLQLLPTTVAALRSSLGCRTPFDLLPAVWITSLGALTMGLLSARLLSRWLR